MTGYNDNPEATAATIGADGWLHTGDLGRMDARGYVRITGRVKEMIIRGGENLFPAEIENAMLEHEAIAEVAVVGIPDEKWGEQVACFLRGNGKPRPDDAALKAFIRERLSPQKTPAYWIWVDEWPLTGSGKIQKFKLRDLEDVEGELILSDLVQRFGKPVGMLGRIVQGRRDAHAAARRDSIPQHRKDTEFAEQAFGKGLVVLGAGLALHAE